MADRTFTPFNYSLEKYPVVLFAQVSFGSSGAPTLEKWDLTSAALATAASTGFKGIKSVSRTSQGLFVFTLQDPYQRLLFAEAVFYVASGQPAAPVLSLRATTAVNSASAPTITVNTLNGSLAATDPASGELGYFRFTVSNSGGA